MNHQPAIPIPLEHRFCARARRARALKLWVGAEETARPVIADHPVWSAGAFRRFLLNQGSIPLSAFQEVDRHDVRSISLAFDATPKGAIGLSDLTVTR